MAQIELTNIGTIYTKGSSVDPTNKTLIISAHGRLVGCDFTKAYQTVVQYAAPQYGALLAALKDAISGKITATELARSGPKESEHAFAWFEKDPSSDKIEVAVAGGNNVDVLTIKTSVTSTRATDSPKLSGIISQLKTQGFTYPSLLILACRVVKEVSTGKELKSFDFDAKKSPSVDLHNQHMKDATAIAQELKGKFALKQSV